MKIEARENIVYLLEVFSGVGLETAEGNQMGICMRDDTFEFSVTPKNGTTIWYRVDMQRHFVEPMNQMPRMTADE